MDFLNQLYSNDNFGIILFAFISILVLAFLIVLFFGKKDQKERKLAETEYINNEPNLNSEVAFGQNAQGTMLEINQVPTNINNQIMNNQMVNTIPPQINTPIPQQPIQEEETNNVPQPPKTDFDFDALAASISKELESIGVDVDDTDNEIPAFDPNKTLVNIPTIPVEEPSPIIEEQSVPPVMNQNPVVFEAPIQAQSIQVPPIQVQENQTEPTVAPIEEKQTVEEKVPLPNPAQFSSVYVNKKTDSGPIMAEPKYMEPSPSPDVKAMELPKTIDLPKLNSESIPKVKPIYEENRANDVFSRLESYHSAYPNNDENRM